MFHKGLPFLAALLAAAGLVAGQAVRVHAQPDASSITLQQFVADGFQANSASPLILAGRPIGTHAIWHRVIGPILSNTFAMIPRAPVPTVTDGSAPFPGAGCQAEYSQDEIVTEGGESTLTVTVYGVRCEPYIPPSAVAAAAASHIKIGTYSILGGTGVFRDVLGGTGAISFDARADGSVFVSIKGHIAYPVSPIHGG